MITFKDIELTKAELGDTIKFIDNINKIECAASMIYDINYDAAKKASLLIGKFYNQPKKAIAHTWKRQSKYGGMNNTELQISKSGIGATSGYRTQIEIYDKVLQDDGYNGSKGLIGDVIDDKEIYEKTLSNLPEKGKSVMNSIKEAREESNIQMPKFNTIKLPVNLSKEEMDIFHIKENNAQISINDSDREVYICFEYPIPSDGYNRTEKQVFKLNQLDIDNETEFQYILFVHYHLPEFKLALEQYIAATKDHKERWAKFKELMNDKLAKYLMLIKI
jgi:hypothetical protein